MMTLKRSPFVITLLALITILSLFGAFSHHHGEEDHGAHECSACRLVQSLSAALLMIVVFLLTAPLKVRHFFFSFQETFQSLLLAVSLKDRAPPVRF